MNAVSVSRSLSISGTLFASLWICHCGGSDLAFEVQDPGHPKIVGGAPFSALPAVGLLTYYGGNHCTGTLISPRTVLTAGHCVYGFSARGMRFLLGADGARPEAIYAAADLVPHPGYDPYGTSGDIGLVILSADAKVSPIGRVARMDATWVGRKLVFVGYGLDDGVHQTGDGVKRAVSMAISEIAGTQFAYEEPGRNTCSGDSGGPAFARDAKGNDLLAGVTSYGDATCTSYGVDTRVDAYLDFLNDNAQ